jgi:hypothetical protein
MFASRPRAYLIVPLLLATVAAVRASWAADSYLDVVPGTALVWGAVNHIGDAAGKLEKLAKIVQAPAANLMDTIKKESGIEKGIDDKGAAGFFLMPDKSRKEPQVAYFVAVTSEKEFLGNFEVVKAGKVTEVKLKSPPGLKPAAPPVLKREVRTSGFVAFLHGYAVIAEGNKAPVEAAAESKQSIAAEMAGYESWLAENDACAVGTAAGIKLAAKEAEPGGSGSTPELEAAAKALSDRFIKNMRSAPKEVSVLMAGIRCDKQGAIRIVARARLIKGGTISQAACRLPPLKVNLLAGVSGGPFVVAAAGIGVPGLLDGYMSLYGPLLKSLLKSLGNPAAGDDAEGTIKESIEAFRQVQSMNFVWKLGKRSDPIYSNMYGTMKLDDSEKFLAAQEKYVAAAKKMIKDAKESGLDSIEAKHLRVAGKPALQMEMAFDFSSMPGADAARAMIDEFIGPSGKMAAYYVANDKQTAVFGVGVPQEKMVTALEVLKQPKKGLAEDAELSVTAAMLPAGSQWVFYVSPRGFMQMMTRLEMVALKSFGPGMMNFSLPTFAKCPPVGLAVKAAPDELRVEMVVPAPVIEATREYVKDMQSAFNDMMKQRGQPPPP